MSRGKGQGGGGRGRDDLASRIARAVDETPPGSQSSKKRSGAGKPGPRGGPRRSESGPDRPALGVMTTTLWEYPSQHYDDSLGRRMQGDKAYVGATPSWVIWQVLTRYSRKGDLVVDPMCGSGTTLDVADDLGRRSRGFDLRPTRPEIELADARELPMDPGVADVAFVDPPYSTHVDYSDDPRCIGKLEATGRAYYEAMGRVLGELERVLRPGGVLAVYVSDSWEKHKGRKSGTLMPIGFELFGLARRTMEPIDIVCVVRHNQKLGRGNWHKAAEEGNYYLRGFNYLLLFRKPKRARGGGRGRERGGGRSGGREGDRGGARGGARGGRRSTPR
ncbi:MAG: DNA methyltransferase [Phycisphaerales bacterium JB040]